jgi:hypothetical protein
VGGIFLRKLEVEKVIRDGLGNVIAYELNSGSIIDNEQAAYMVELGELSNVEALPRAKGEVKIQGKGFDIGNLPELK